MKCYPANKLSQYIDDLLTEQENAEIQAHLKSCEDCMQVIEAFKEEERFLKETLQTPTLPDHFASMVLNELEPYEQKAVRRKKSSWKQVMMIAAGVVLAFGLSTTLHPSFAEWLGGVFTTEQVDEGLRMATDSGLTKRVDQEVTDQGITLKVEDVMADSSRVALSYQVLNKNGKPKDTYIEWADTENEIIAIDQDGNLIESFGSSWSEGSDYGLIEFSLREHEITEKVTVAFDLVELNGVKGNWKLEIPVDLKEIHQLTTTHSLEGEQTSKHDVAINLKKVQFAPSSNELFYETAFTEEEQARVEGEIEKHKEAFGEESVTSFTNYGTAIEYHIENEQGKVISQHNTFFKGKGHPSDTGNLGGSGQDMEQIGHLAWNDSYIPQKDDDKLTFVLDGVFKTIPSDFSIKIKPKELRKSPVSFEYEGNFITIQKAKFENDFYLRKSLIPIGKETIFKIEMVGRKRDACSRSWCLGVSG